MTPSPDITNLLRQKQLMDQLNQTTGQGTGAAMLGGGANLRQFDDTGGGSEISPTGVVQHRQQPGILASTAFAGPLGGLGAAARQQHGDSASNPLAKISQGIGNLTQGVMNRITAPIQNAQINRDLQSIAQRPPGIGPVNPPTMKINPQALQIDPVTGEVIRPTGQ